MYSNNNWWIIILILILFSCGGCGFPAMNNCGCNCCGSCSGNNCGCNNSGSNSCGCNDCGCSCDCCWDYSRKTLPLCNKWDPKKSFGSHLFCHFLRQVTVIE